MVRFSKYFFFLFTILTICPLLVFFAWNRYQVDEFHRERHRLSISFGSDYISHAYTRYLQEEKAYLARISNRFSSQTLSIDHYKALFDATEVSEEPAFPLRHQPNVDYEIHFDPDQKRLLPYIRFIIPLKSNPHQVIVIHKKMVFQKLRPPGPFFVSIYVGNSLAPESLLGIFRDPHITHKNERYEPDMGPPSPGLPPGFDTPAFPPPLETFKNRKELSNAPPLHDSVMDTMPDAHLMMPHHPSFEHDHAPFMPGGPREGSTGTPTRNWGPGWNEGPFFHHPNAAITPTALFEDDSDKGNWDIDPSLTKDILLKSHDGTPIFRILLQSPLPQGMKKKALQSDYWMALIILLSGCVSSLFAGKYLNKNFIKPLILLSSATDQINQGELDTRIDTTQIKHPDVLVTFESFNRMVHQLQEKEKLKKNLISNLTHDLRTPLIAQERTLELLLKELVQMNPQQQETFCKSLLKNNRHLLNMVNQLLETYQFEEGKIKLTFREIHLKDIIKQCFEQLLPLAEDRHIALIVDLPETLAPFNGDPQCLQRVFINLIANAIENIPKASTVRIMAIPHEETLEIHVKDNGQGIPEAQLKQLFERYTGGYGDTRKIGTGLGLYICKMFIEAHHGQITVESELGQYTDFKIVLPVHLRNEEEESR